MFAFALYSRPERRLILGRDRLGIKPLYYAHLPDRLVFASELKALFALLPHQPELTAEGIASFLAKGYMSGPDTLVAGVRRLEPGTVLVIDEALNPRSVSYWRPRDIEPRPMTFDEAQEVFDPLFAQVMREHMRSDVPYGLFLSGGIDSGVLLGALTTLGLAPVTTYSVGYRHAGARDELDDAKRVAERFGSEHHDLRFTPDQVLRALPLSVWAADALIDDAACLPTALMTQRAANDLKVVFTGEGGDEVFAGYGRYRRSPLQRFLRRRFGSAARQRDSRGLWSDGLRQAVFGPGLSSQTPGRRWDDASRGRSVPPTWSALTGAQYADLRGELTDSLLVKVDRMLMAFGVEGRVPLLDHRLVELGLSLPDHLKVRHRIGKVFLRRWARRYLPREHLERRKSGFGVPLSTLLQGPFLQQLGEQLRRSPVLQEWLRPEAVPILVECQQQRGGASRQLLQLLRLALWHRLFIAGPLLRPSVDEPILDWLD